jgi:hypothetical protein
MRSELIQVGDKTLQADEVVVPDIRYIGILVTKADQELLEHAYRSAIRVHTLILTRERKKQVVQKHFEIDLPDLWCACRELRAQERTEVVNFMVIFQALVNHLLPEAQVTSYTYDGKIPAGVKYQGEAWISE